MAPTTPAPERDATLDLLVPPRSRRGRAAAITGGVALVAGAIALGAWWPGVEGEAFSYVSGDGTFSTDADGFASIFRVARPGPDVPVVLESLEAPPGWHIRHVSVAPPSDDIHDLGEATELTPLPAALADRTRVVVEWEPDCAAVVQLVREQPSMISTSVEETAGLPAGTTLYLRPQTATAHLRILGTISATVGDGVGDPRLSRTPSIDLAERCSLGAEQVRELRGETR